ncbi:flavodoxin domain-containing protein [Streptosporangium sp. NPDC051022]|uniref:flavodoxin domain-containing protein n=1 Tax=Streptosporangium sp. NPDC051022 TaxID=3155752 RepID=UPI00342AD504
MRALVVYESMFGNTQRIAEAVADGLSSRMEVNIVEVGSAPTVLPGGIDLLLLGGPTHAFGLTRAATRRTAAEQAGRAGCAPISKGIGLREWLEAVRISSVGTAAAAFDTRIGSHLPGSAARGAERRLRGLGLTVAAPAMSFHVMETMGPLADGEVERARKWGGRLAATLALQGTRKRAQKA